MAGYRFKSSIASGVRDAYFVFNSLFVLSVKARSLGTRKYEGVGGTKKWERIDSYGPKFVENIVQATARDILVEAMRRLEAAGYQIVMHVHDEAVIEAPADSSLEDICAIMGQTPAWAGGLLLRADGYVCDFYQKD